MVISNPSLAADIWIVKRCYLRCWMNIFHPGSRCTDGRFYREIRMLWKIGVYINTLVLHQRSGGLAVWHSRLALHPPGHETPTQISVGEQAREDIGHQISARLNMWMVWRRGGMWERREADIRERAWWSDPQRGDVQVEKAVGEITQVGHVKQRKSRPSGRRGAGRRRGWTEDQPSAPSCCYSDEQADRCGSTGISINHYVCRWHNET